MNLEFKIAKTQEELNAIYRLRYEAYATQNYFKPEEFPNGLDIDKFDAVSVHFYAYNSNLQKVVGTIRIIPDSALGLPLDELYDVSMLRQAGKALAEISRRVTAPGHVKANFGLLQCVCKYAAQKEINHLLFVVNPKDIPQYERFGAERLDGIKYYYKVHDLAVGFHIEITKFNPPFDQLLYSDNPAINFN